MIDFTSPNFVPILSGVALVITAVGGFLSVRSKNTVTYSEGLEKYVKLLKEQLEDTDAKCNSALKELDALKKREEEHSLERTSLLTQIQTLQREGVDKDTKITNLQGEVDTLKRKLLEYEHA